MDENFLKRKKKLALVTSVILVYHSTPHLINRNQLLYGLKKQALLSIDWGDTPTLDLLWGVLVWIGLYPYTHRGYHYFEKNFWKKIWWI